MSEVSLNEFKKFNIKVGEVKKLTEKAAIFCEDKIFICNRENIDLEVGNKIVVFIAGDECAPLVVRINGTFIPIVPEKDIELGSKIE